MGDMPVHHPFSTNRTNELVLLAKASLLLLALLFFLASCASARDYSIDSATAHITVSPEGIVHVEESISYSFEGTYYEVYRQVYPPEGGSIENIRGYCDNGECEFRVVPISGGYELVGTLPQPTPGKVTFVVAYDYYRGVKVYNDISELHYKMWGEEWEKPLDSFTATITLSGGNGDEITYWVHPDDYTTQSNLQNNVISIKSDRIPAYRLYEIRAVYPRIESPDANFVSIQNEDGLDEVLSVEKAYEFKRKIARFILLLISLIVAGVFVFPFIIYFKYGREPKIDYNALYEREPPTDSKPAYVNAILRGRIGMPTIEGFTGTVMDLVIRDYVTLHDIKLEKKFIGLFSHETEDIVIEINEKANVGELLDFEADVYKLLKSHAPSGSVLWSELRKDLGKGTEFYEFIIKWNNKVKNHIKADRLFLAQGNTYMALFSVLFFFAVVLGFLFLFDYFPPNLFPFMTYAIYMAVPALIFTICVFVLVLVNEQSFGKWTPEGRLFQKRWKNFSSYLTDLSALKEHPPESIRIWDSYMVYAVAMGVAEKALKNMSLTVPAEHFGHSHFYSIHHSSMITSGFSSAYNASSPQSSSSGGGVGAAGGGFGGGGGGAR